MPAGVGFGFVCFANQKIHDSIPLRAAAWLIIPCGYGIIICAYRAAALYAPIVLAVIL